MILTLLRSIVCSSKFGYTRATTCRVLLQGFPSQMWNFREYYARTSTQRCVFTRCVEQDYPTTSKLVFGISKQLHINKYSDNAIFSKITMKRHNHHQQTKRPIHSPSILKNVKNKIKVKTPSIAHKPKSRYRPR